MKKVILLIEGMTCSACSSGLEKYLNKQKGINSASVNLVMNTASIEYDNNFLDLKDLDKFVENAGFKSLGIYNLEKEEKNVQNKKNKIIVLIFVAILIMYISMSHMLNLPCIKYLNSGCYPINFSLTLFGLASISIGLTFNILKNGLKNLIHKTPNMDTLVTIGVLVSYFYSLYGTIMISGGKNNYINNLYFESVSMVLCFIEIGKFIENKNKNKTKEALKKLMTITPKDATILKEGQEVKLTIDEIQKGDIVICKPGEKIAVDGIVENGVTHIDESFITGESIPVKKEKGSNVIAGSINYEGFIKYRAEKIGKESTISEIVKEVNDMTNTKIQIERIADKICGYFVPAIIILAIITFFIWIIISKDMKFSINIFVSILLVACPCSLGLATPLAIVIASRAIKPKRNFSKIK